MTMICHSLPMAVCFATQQVAWEDFSHYSADIGPKFFHPILAAICVIIFFGGFIFTREVKQFDALRAVRNIPHIISFLSACIWAVLGILCYSLFPLTELFLSATVFESIFLVSFAMGMLTDVFEQRNDPFVKRFNLKIMSAIVFVVICPPIYLSLCYFAPLGLLLLYFIVAFFCVGLCGVCCVYLIVKLRSPVLGVCSIVLSIAFIFVVLSGRIGSNFLSQGSEAFAVFEVYSLSLLALMLAFFLLSKFSAKYVLLYHTFGIVKLMDGSFARIIAKPDSDIPLKVLRARGTKRELKLSLDSIEKENYAPYLLALYRQGRRKVSSVNEVVNNAEPDYSFPVLQGIREQIAMIPKLYNEFRRKPTPMEPDMQMVVTIEDRNSIPMTELNPINPSKPNNENENEIAKVSMDGKETNMNPSNEEQAETENDDNNDEIKTSVNVQESNNQYDWVPIPDNTTEPANVEITINEIDVVDDDDEDEDNDDENSQLNPMNVFSRNLLRRGSRLSYSSDSSEYSYGETSEEDQNPVNHVSNRLIAEPPPVNFSDPRFAKIKDELFYCKERPDDQNSKSFYRNLSDDEDDEVGRMV